MFAKLLCRILGVTQLDLVYRRAVERSNGGSVFQAVGDDLDLRLVLSNEDREYLRVDGPVVLCANHPTGAMEAIALTALLDSVRSDLKMIGHVWFRRWPEVARKMFLVDPGARSPEGAAKVAATKGATRWLRNGNSLLVFPAGEVARFDLRRRTVTDAPWRTGLAQVVRMTRATVVPLHFSGRNSLLYYVLSCVHPRLGALLLARECLNKRGKPLAIRVGKPIRFERLETLGSVEKMTAFLREAVERLDPKAA
jgi:putative hemolysin